MAKKVTKSSFMDRLAVAHEEHKSDETRVGSGGDLPSGIDHGIARLVDCRIGVFQKGNNEGEPYFMAAGTVLEPDSVVSMDPKTKKARTIPIRGLRTQIGPEPLCDTTAQNGNETSLADHWDRVLNHLRLLGIDTKDIEPSDVVAEESEGVYTTGPILEALMEAAPTFRFRTWQGKPTPQWPDPRVNHEWRGVCEYDAETGDAVQDDTEEPAQWESDEAKAEPAKATIDKTTKTKAPAKEPEPDTEPDEEEVDYVALGKVADSGKPKKASEDAARTLTAQAAALEIEGYEDMETWAQVAVAIVENMEGGEESYEEESEEEEYTEEAEEWFPVVGELGYFLPPKSKSPVQCEFTEVNTKTNKVSLKRLDTKKIVKGVPFDKVGPNDEIPF